MAFRPRLIPAVICAATVLLGFKVSDIFSLGVADHALAQAPSPTAATGAPIDLTSQANAAKAPPPPAQTAQLAPASASATQSAPAAANSAVAAPPPSAAPAGTAPQGAAAPTATGAAQAADASAGPHAPIKDPLLLSPAEIEVLQELSQRRSALDQRASEIDQQQVVLQAAEKRVDEKIAKLETLQKSIQAAVDKENAAEDARTQSLVKIYETMKPSDAAQILSQLDMPIVLQMFSHMKEAKTAPILAAMDPMKAEVITSALAHKQPTVTPAAANAAARPAAAPQPGP